MKAHEHRYERLSDEAIFCACGDIRFAAAQPCPLPHFPTYPYWGAGDYWWQPYRWTVTSGSGNNITIGNTAMLPPDAQISYTDGTV